MTSPFDKRAKPPHQAPHPATQAQQQGLQAEAQAAAYLRTQGFTIHAQRYRHKRHEIDLIASKGQLLLFVEVKWRTHTAFGHPEQFVTPQQQQGYAEAAAHYMDDHPWQGAIRFDIIAISPGNFMHLQDAFY